MIRNSVFEQVTDYRGDTRRNRNEISNFDRINDGIDASLHGRKTREDVPSASFEPRRGLR